jgi:hypothetical protein
MPDPTTIDEAIEQQALGPKRVTVAGQSTELPSIDELIKADNHLAGKQAAQSSSLGVRVQRFVPQYE